MFNSIGLDTNNNCTSRDACDCVKKAIWDAWGSTFRNSYPSWEKLCLSENCTSTEWKDPKTAVCRRKALLAVLASTEVSVVEMALVKSEPLSSVFQSIELRLKDGNIDADPDRIINWTVVAGSAAPWLSLRPLNGSLYSSESVAAVKAAAVGAGLGDTATTGPLNTTLTFKSSARLMKRSDFVNGTDQQTITVRLSIFAKPYVNQSHVRISRSSNTTVEPAEPIEAGEKLMVSVNALDFEGLPISRPDLQLRLEIRGNLNKNQSIPLQLKAEGTNVYTANISETWVREPETIQSAAFGLFRWPCGSRPVRCPAPRRFTPHFGSISVPRPSLERLVVYCRMPRATFDDILYWRYLKIVEPSNKLIVLGATAGAITTLVLLAALYAPLDCCFTQPCPCRSAVTARSAPP